MNQHLCDMNPIKYVHEGASSLEGLQLKKRFSYSPEHRDEQRNNLVYKLYALSYSVMK